MASLASNLCAQNTTSFNLNPEVTEPLLEKEVIETQDVETEDGRVSNKQYAQKVKDAWVYKQIQLRQGEFTSYREAKVFCGTWNVNAKKAQVEGISLSLENWLGQAMQCDLVAIGLQEIVDLNAVNVAVDNKSVKTSQYWLDKIGKSLDGGNGTFRLVGSRHLVGILICVFVRVDHLSRVKYVDTEQVAVGVMGIAGNKGGVSVRVQFYDSTFCFINSHLAAHRENVIGRNNDFKNIFERTKFDIGIEAVQEVINAGSLHLWRTGDSSVKIVNHDHVFWFGDLNYRIDDSISTEACLDMAERGELESLLIKDQLNIERRQERVFQKFYEGQLTFKPTYKYQPNTNMYEKRPEKKLRAPAWCDRILWRAITPQHVKQLSYACCQTLNVSDHKPVMSTFVTQVKDIVQERRISIHNELLRMLDTFDNSSMPILNLDRMSLDFGEIRYGSSLTLPLTIANAGKMYAAYRFVPKLDEQTTCKPWISLSSKYGFLIPGEKTTIDFTITIDNFTAMGLNAGNTVLSDVLVLRLERGRDYYVTVKGTYARSCFCMSLNELVRYNVPIRRVPLDPVKRSETGIQSDAALCVPSELWRIIDALYRHGLHQPDLFSLPGDEKSCREIRECLDTGVQFGNFDVHSLAKTLIDFLSNLSESVIPQAMFPQLEVDDQNIHQCARILLESLPPIHYNVFIYCTAFFREVLLYKESNKVTAAKLARLCCECMVLGSSYQLSFEETKASVTRRAGMQLLMDHFLTSNSF